MIRSLFTCFASFFFLRWHSVVCLFDDETTATMRPPPIFEFNIHLSRAQETCITVYLANLCLKTL